VRDSIAVPKEDNQRQRTHPLAIARILLAVVVRAVNTDEMLGALAGSRKPLWL